MSAGTSALKLRQLFIRFGSFYFGTNTRPAGSSYKGFIDRYKIGCPQNKTIHNSQFTILNSVRSLPEAQRVGLSTKQWRWRAHFVTCNSQGRFTPRCLRKFITC